MPSWRPAPGEPSSEPFALRGRLFGAVADTEGAGVGAGASPPDAADAAGMAGIAGAVVVADGRIVAVDTSGDGGRLPTRVLDAAFVAPGFVDLQVNGGFGYEVGDDPAALRALAARLPATGVTAFLPTLVSRHEREYPGAVAAARAIITDGAGPGTARVLGLHLEGPLLSPERAGAHQRTALEAATADLINRLADPACVRLVTLAPERPGALGLIARLRARGVMVSLGHTDASFEIFTAGVDAGATLATHIFNAMSPFHHRAPGAVGAALTDDRVIALVIADGIHSHPAALRLAARAKGPDRLALVTDAIAAAGGSGGTSRLAGQPVFVDDRGARLGDGTLAGSTLTMDRAVRNVVRFTGMSAATGVHLATAVPACALGADRGGGAVLAPGATADLVLLDDGLRVVATFVGGVLSPATPQP